MCLYPRIIKNPKYKPNKKNGGVVPEVSDPRELSIPIGCGVCVECLRQKGNWWYVRLAEEINNLEKGQKAYMVTLTFDEESIDHLIEAAGENEGNKIATLAIRRFLERWRKKYKRSVKHWFITEHGHVNTERIHIHGIIITDVDIEEGMTKIEKRKNRRNRTSLLARIWQYGLVHIGKYVNESTSRYITKYCTKRDYDHPGYVAKTLCSPGIGAAYHKSELAKKRHQFRGEKTLTKYKSRSGHEWGIPTYYRRRLWNEYERTYLWLSLLNKQERWVLGVRIDVSKGEEEYYKRLMWAQKKNTEWGYDSPTLWEKTQYKARRDEYGLL